MQRLVNTLLPNLDTAPESTVVGPHTPAWVEDLSGNSVFLHDHFRGNEPSLESRSWEDRSTRENMMYSGDSPEREEPGIWEPSTVVLLAPIL